MYSNAELFGMAAKQSKEVFLGNVTLSIPDDSDGCADLDAEKDRLGRIWAAARMSVREMVVASGISQTAFARVRASRAARCRLVPGREGVPNIRSIPVGRAL